MVPPRKPPSLSSTADLASSLSCLPPPSPRRLRLRVVPPAERHLRDGHPWLYDTSISEQDGEGSPGDFAVVFDRKNRFLSIGLYDPASPIRVRMLLSGKPAAIDGAWFGARMGEAVALRASLSAPDLPRTDGYRLVGGESDGFPGLVVDRYADTLVVKLYTQAWIPHLPVLLPALLEIQRAERLVLRLNRSMRREPSLLHGLTDGQILFGPPLEGPVVFSENGLRFEADPLHGQKTGFFLDQRDNRSRVEELSRGREVLNVFSYTGGFSLYAARGGARSVTSVDLSAPAIAGVERNFALNMDVPRVRSCPHHPVVGDAFDVLSGLAQSQRRFGLVVLDPPMFAQSKSQVEPALEAYRRLCRMGLAVLEPGGTLVQASCSSRVPAEAFFAAVEETANEMGRPLRDIQCTSHAVDHPARFLESSYLKCLFATA
ncbi:MAG TPA: class I SAM-dependent methyltransferase [Fibrobacteria bacterium]|nr:class I SAM-dependent methyltransferase [Fibrobacteria bacterium]